MSIRTLIWMANLPILQGIHPVAHHYLQLEGMGVFTTNGYDPGVSEAKLEELRAFGASL